MSKTAYFFCDVDNFEHLQDATWNAKHMNYKRQKYKVIDTIILNDEQFDRFKKDICQPVDFLQNVTSKLGFSEECEYICLAVINENSDAIILVCSFQYPYPKFVAVVRRDSYGEKIY